MFTIIYYFPTFVTKGPEFWTSQPPPLLNKGLFFGPPFLKKKQATALGYLSHRLKLERWRMRRVGVMCGVPGGGRVSSVLLFPTSSHFSYFFLTFD